MSTLFERVLLVAASGRKRLCLISGSHKFVPFLISLLSFFTTFMVKCECHSHSDTLFHVKLRCVNECIQPGWIPSEPLSEAPPTDQSNLCCPVDLHSGCHVCCLRPARLHSLLHVKVNLDRVHGSEDGRSLSSPPLPPPLLSIIFSVFFHFLWSLSCFWKFYCCFPLLVSASSVSHTRAFQSCRCLL